jgi:hypothetical protein
LAGCHVQRTLDGVVRPQLNRNVRRFDQENSMAVRETHSAVRDGKRLVWYTEKLWSQARTLEPFDIELSTIRELDQDCWFGPGSSGRKPVGADVFFGGVVRGLYPGASGQIK